MKIDPYYQRQRYSAMTVVSGNSPYKVYADIRGGSLESRASNDSGGIENVDFQGFRTLHLRNLRK